MGFHQKFPYSTPISSRSQPHFSEGRCKKQLRRNRHGTLDIHAQLREPPSVEKRSSLVRNFAITGFVFGELYMFFAVASPRLKGVEIPADAMTARLLASSLLFGPFGLAMGTGLGLLADGLRRLVVGAREKKEKDRIV
jgi:hypothetical protein